MNAIDALDAARRGLDRLRDTESYKNDSRTLPGLEVAVTYLAAQIDLLRHLDGAASVDLALEAPRQVAEAEDNGPAEPDDGVVEMREASTNVFEAVTEDDGSKSPKRAPRHRE